MTHCSIIHLVSCRLTVTLIVLVTTTEVVYSTPELLRKNVGQAEETRLSLVQQLTSSSRQLQQPTRLVGVVEPGRLLNIFLGVVLLVGLAVLNSIIFMAIGVTGNLPPRFVRPTRRRPPFEGEAIIPEFAGRVFDAISRR